MTAASGLERELFTRVPRQLLEAWLAGELAEAYKYLASGVEPHMIHRAQGRVHLIEKMQALLRQHNAQ